MRTAYRLCITIILTAPIFLFGQEPANSLLEKLTSGLFPGDLSAAAKGMHPSAHALYTALSRPADRLTLKDDKILEIRPVSDFLAAKPVLTDPLEVHAFEDKNIVPRTVTGADLKAFVPYEETALERIEVFGRIQDDGVTATDRLAAADMALRAVLRFHEAARRRPALGASPWDDLRGRLEQALITVRRKLAEQLAADASGLAVADYLFNVHRQDAVIRGQVKRVWAQEAGLLAKKEDWSGLRDKLSRVDREFAYASEFDPLRHSLREQADRLMKAGSDKEAYRLWPRLPELREAIARRNKRFETLYVAVRSLPEFLSPQTAWTESEKLAVDLLFESLVEAEVDAKGSSKFLPQLAAAMSSHGEHRRFDMIRDAYWSDGTRVTPSDVRHTVQLLRRNDLPGRVSTTWHDVPRVNIDGFAVDFKTAQGLFDGLEPFSFKVLPEHYSKGQLVRADDEAFAKAPLGSGPFVFSKRETVSDRVYAVFTANPHYVRQSAPGRPFIDEIRMFAWTTPKDLIGLPHPAHVVLGIPTETLARAPKKLGVRSQLDRRVYFLAMNHRRPIFGDANFRRALAHALHRDQLLTDHFRGGQTALNHIEALGAASAIFTLQRRHGRTDLHFPLSGPYPLKSWATCPPPRVPVNLHDATLARTLAKQALKPDTTVELTLKYPVEAAGVDGVCKDIKAAIEQLAADVKATVRVKLVGLSARAMKLAIENRDFDLAYHHHDHSHASFDLWPLFDPSADALRVGGSNYLGYEGDGKLQSLMRSAQSHRNFAELQEITHNIHARLYDQMPLIPLWQLHSHFAIASNVAAGPIDSLKVFANIAEWKLQR